MQPPLNPRGQSMQVMVNGKPFDWIPGQGLDPSAVLELGGFIRKEAWKHRTRWDSAGVGEEDLLNCGYIGAMGAAALFRPDAGVCFLSYASKWVKGELLKALQKSLVRTPDGEEWATFVRPDVYQPLEGTGDGWDFVSPENDLRKTVEEIATDEERHSRLEAALARLSPLHRDVLERGEGLAGRKRQSMNAISKDLGMSRYQAERLFSAASSKLAQMLLYPEQPRISRKGLVGSNSPIWNWLRGGDPA